MSVRIFSKSEERMFHPSLEQQSWLQMSECLDRLEGMCPSDGMEYVRFRAGAEEREDTEWRITLLSEISPQEIWGAQYQIFSLANKTMERENLSPPLLLGGGRFREERSSSKNHATIRP